MQSGTRIKPFPARVDQAADHILAGRIHGRELDDAFENYDGEFVVCALMRLAETHPPFKTSLTPFTDCEGSKWCEIHDRFRFIRDEELPGFAKAWRKHEAAIWEEELAEFVASQKAEAI